MYDVCDKFIDRFDRNEEVIGKREEGEDDNEESVPSLNSSMVGDGKATSHQESSGLTNKTKRGKAPKQVDSSALSGGIEESKEENGIAFPSP